MGPRPYLRVDGRPIENSGTSKICSIERKVLRTVSV